MSCLTICISQVALGKDSPDLVTHGSSGDPSRVRSGDFPGSANHCMKIVDSLLLGAISATLRRVELLPDPIGEGIARGERLF